MEQQKIEQKIEEIILANGYDLVDFKIVNMDSSPTIRIAIDKDDGVNLDDCSLVTKEIDRYLEEQRFKNLNYFVEVNSPGLDRVLKREKDFIKFIGKKVKVKFKEKIDNRKTFVGVLTEYKDNKIKIMEDGKEFVFDLDKVDFVRLVIEF
ncbi:ribosome maturation factor RimP [bacterium]|nr:ribosome maturation factor RimP [bacterium]